jgi:hypothetical protein
VTVDPKCVARVIAALERAPSTIEDARRTGSDGGIPDTPGFYAWWAAVGALSGAEGTPHPTLSGLRSFYVGISPAREGTAQRLRGRVVGNHIRGNTGGSTFRLALAALLLESRGYQPCLRIDRKGRRKYVLPREQNGDLRAWQEEHLRVSWAECPAPWRPGLEAAVIAHFKPPLNLAENSSHPFYQRLKKARDRYRSAARRC